MLCEKPITVNDSEFKTLITLAKEKQVFLMEAMWTYFLPAVQKAKAWLDEGRIGKLKVIHSDFAFAMEKKLQGRMYNPKLAGGALLRSWHLSHCYGLLFYRHQARKSYHNRNAYRNRRG